MAPPSRCDHRHYSATTRTTTTAMLLLALALASSSSRQSPFFVAASDVVDGGGGDDGGVGVGVFHHGERAHLSPHDYGAGLRLRRGGDDERQGKRGKTDKKNNKNKKDKNKKDKNKPKDKPKNNNRPNNRPKDKPKNKPKKNKPDNKPKYKPNDSSKFKPNDSSKFKPSGSGGGGGGGGGSSSSSSAAAAVLERLSDVSSTIDDDLFLYETPTLDWVPSTIYKHDGLDKGLRVMNSQGVAGMTFYLGGESCDGKSGMEYGLVNVAAFLAQSMKETIKYNACSENNWDLYGTSGYPLSNACGQLGQSYQDYHCPKGEEHMECEVDPDMEITATTNAKWYGAPAPFFCRPKKDKDDFTGRWNYGKFCNLGWVDPPMYCDDYPGQKAGGFENDEPVANRAGRTDVEGCCWWGRGVIQTTGICNFGKLNYYLGARAAREGRRTPYGEIDFCRDPEAICSADKFPELKWIAGMMYWMESVQRYDERGWNYMDELRDFVDGGYADGGRFIDAVSGIVNRGCHDPPCGTGAVDGGNERRDNFDRALSAFGLGEPLEEGRTGPGGSVGRMACGADYFKAAETCDATCKSNLDCPAGTFCYNDVVCQDK